MNPFLAIARGIRAAVAPGSLVALGWIYALLASLAAALTIVVFMVISQGAANSAVASQLRSGMSADWLIDTFSQQGSGGKFMAVALFALVLAVVYVVGSTLLSGGVASRVLDAVDGFGSTRETFLGECGRFAGPMLRVSLIELIFLGVIGGAMFIGWGIGLASDAGHVFAWGSIAAIAFVLAAIIGISDVARAHVVSTGDRSAVAAWRDALSHSFRRAPVFLMLVLFNLGVAIVVAWIALTIHGTISRETGGGVIIALVVGQIGIVGRIWARIVALATQASLWKMSA